MERYELPDGWEWMKLPDVADIIMGQSPPGSTYNKSGNGLPFYQGKADFGNPFPSPRVYCTAPKKVALPGDILMSVRAPVGPTNLVNQECAIGRGLSIIRPKEGMPANYLRTYFTLIEQFIAELGTGSTFTSISRSDLEDLDIPVSPPSERQRIITKIESLFEQSRTARAALTRVPALMSQFRRAVLASAFRGELVEPDPNDEPAASLLERIRDTREQSGYKKTIEPIDTSDLPELPEGWEWVKIEQIGDVSGGLTKNSKRSALSEKLPYLRVANVYFNRLELSDVQDIGIQESELERTLLKKGDLLVVEGNGSIEQIGRVAVWDGSIEPCVHQNHVIKIRFSPTDISRYILFWLLSTEGRDQIMKVTSSTSGLYTLSLSKVSQLLVPLAPLALQSRIVAKIEALFAQADIIEQAASVSLRRAEQVDQSILARAFRGELG